LVEIAGAGESKMSKILDWFQGNLADKTTWIAICGVIVAFTNLTLDSEQIAAIAALGAVLFTIRDKHIVAAGKNVKRMCNKRKAIPIQEQVEQDADQSLADILDNDRKL
jgi:hypothetical protein